MIKLKLNTSGEIEAMIEYIEEGIECIYIESGNEKSGSFELLEYQAHIELLENLIKKLKIKQLNDQTKINIEILKIQAILIIKYNHIATFGLNIYNQNMVLATSSEIHNQLINH